LSNQDNQFLPSSNSIPPRSQIQNRKRPPPQQNRDVPPPIKRNKPSPQQQSPPPALGEFDDGGGACALSLGEQFLSEIGIKEGNGQDSGHRNQDLASSSPTK